MGNCKIQRQGDENFCSTCARRWGVDENAPCVQLAPPLRTIVGLTGAAGSGKSTVAKHLHVYCGFRVIKFAAALKNGLAQMMRTVGMSEHEIDRAIEGDMKQQPLDVLCGHTPRHAMQTLGTEWGRNCMGDDFWVNMVRVAIGNTPIGSKIVIDDVRFENEVALIHELGGKVVMITGRGGIDGHHPSEAGVNVVPDMYIVNTGAIADLLTNAHPLSL